MSNESANSMMTKPRHLVKQNEWPIFISYRRSDSTRRVALWLKEQLEAEAIEATTGQIFGLDVFVDVAEPHQVDFQANLEPHLQHSRALIVLADQGAAYKKPVGGMDYLYQELDWWVANRTRTPPIILQLDSISATTLVAATPFASWRKVNFIDCFWDKWESDQAGGESEKRRLVKTLRESIRDYGQIIHLSEVRRLKRRAVIALAFAFAALLGAMTAGVLARYYAKEKGVAETNLVTANNNLADSYSERAESLAKGLDFTTSQLFFARALELKPDSDVRIKMSQFWHAQSRWLWTLPPPAGAHANASAATLHAAILGKGAGHGSIVAGYSNGLLELVSQSGAILATRVAPSAITSVEVINRQSWIATGHEDHRLRVWDAVTLHPIKELPLPNRPVVIKGNDEHQVVAIGYADGGIAFWKIPSFDAFDTVDAHEMGVSAIAFDPKRNVVYWGGGGEYVWVYDLDDKSAQRGLPKRGWTNILAIQPSGQYLSVGGQDRIVGLIDLDKGQSLRAENNDCEISAACFAPDGQLLVVGDVNGKLRLFSMSLGKPVANLPTHPGAITDVVVGDDGVIISACSDGRLRAWALPQPVTVRYPAAGSTMKEAFQRFTAETGQKHPLDVDTGRYDPTVVECFFSSLGTPHAVSAILSDGRLCNWDETSGAPKTRQICGAMFGQALSPTSGRVAVLSGIPERDLQVFNLANSGAALFTQRISTELGGYVPVALSGDGTTVACALPNGAVRCWTVERGTVRADISSTGSDPTAISFDPTGDLVAVGYRNGRVLLHKLTGDQAAVLVDVSSSAIRCIVVKDEMHMFIAGSDRLSCYDSRTKGRRWDFAGNVSSIAIDGMGRWCAGGTVDGEIHIIDIGTGSRIITLEREGEGAEAVSFDSSGDFIAWGDRRGRMFIQPLRELRAIHSDTPESLLAEAVKKGGFSIQGADAPLTGEGKGR